MGIHARNKHDQTADRSADSNTMWVTGMHSGSKTTSTHGGISNTFSDAVVHVFFPPVSQRKKGHTLQ